MAWRIYRYEGYPTFWPAESTVYVDLPGGIVEEYIVDKANVPRLVAGGGVSSGTLWGDITGSISAQTDLQAALDAKSDISSEYLEIEAGDVLLNNCFVFIDTDNKIYAAVKDLQEAIGYVPVGGNPGDFIKVYNLKKIYTVPTMSFIPGTPLYLGDNSDLTEYDPFAKCPQQVGIAIDTTHFLLDVRPWELNTKPFRTFTLERRNLNY